MIFDRNSTKHPCFAAGSCAGKFGRIHLPVAPACNIQCNYCKRSFDCQNESRPGVTSKVISPQEALERYRAAKRIIPNLAVAGIAGPGDALANIAETMATLELIRKEDSGVLFCVSTNGLLLPRYAGDLYRVGVSHITVTVNAVDTEIGRRIYRFIDYDGKRITQKEAAGILLNAQIEGIQRAVALGMLCKINIVAIKGLNDSHIPDIVQKVKEAGAVLANIMQLIPVKGTLYEDLPMLSRKELDGLRKRCEPILSQMYHCRQCRSDAAGTLDNDQSYLFAEKPPCAAATAAAGTGAKTGGALRFAAATNNGLIVNEHFGHVTELSIYECSGEDVHFIEKRDVSRYCHPAGDANCGAHTQAIDSITSALCDCRGVLVMRIGEVPRAALAEKGIKTFLAYDYIEAAVRDAASKIRGRKRSQLPQQPPPDDAAASNQASG